jgi:hypothetical protein
LHGRSRRRDFFDAVIGVSGIGSEARAKRTAGKVNWIGIGPRKASVRGKRGAEVTFDHFLDFGTGGPGFRRFAPRLVERMCSKNARYLMDGLGEQQLREALNILRMAKDAPPSRKRDGIHVRACRFRRCVSTDSPRC